MKVLRHVSLVLACIAIVSIVAYQVFFGVSLPSYEGSIELEGLGADVEVRFDDYGIPHIFAGNDEDLFFAQGYLMARERMFQMDMTRRAGRGELSTLFGEKTVGTDRFLKTVGFYRLACAEYRDLSPEAKQAILAYTRGVNTYLRTTKHLPREYVFLRSGPPEPWRPEDTVVCGTLMAFSLTRAKKIELILYRVGEVAGREVLEAFIPSYPEFAPLVSGPGPARKRATRSIPFFRFPAPSLVAGMSETVLEPPEIAASNWMIFSGALTRSGKPIFTGSPDLKPRIPALFYIVHLKSPDLDVIGGAIPGTPGVHVVGFNGRIAWSAVNGRIDELDYFVERPDPEDPGRYLTEHGPEPFRVVEEVLKVRTKEGIREERFQVRISRHGPIISDVMPLAPKNTAMHWIGMVEPTGLFEGFLALAKASSFDAFHRALGHVRTPSLNFGYADAEGNIGYQYVGSVPIRKKGDGVLPVPGWTGEYEWEGTVPYEDLPHDLNPAKGYLASFNNRPVETAFPMTHYYLFERAMRFEELAPSLGSLGLEEARALQLDTGSVVAERWVPLVRRACEGRRDLAEALRLFEGWDYGIRTESAAATLFNAFYFRMMKNTLADEVGEPLWSDYLTQSYIIYVPDLVMTRILDRPGHPLYDDVTTRERRENRDEIIVKSLEEAVAELTGRLGPDPAGWTWGKVHRMTFAHPLGTRLPFLNLKPIPTQGDTFTINAGMWNNKKPYEMESGGVIRLVVDFANVERSTIICPPGQSGHYRSPHYDDWARVWAEGKQVPMHFLSARELPKRLLLKAGTRP